MKRFLIPLLLFLITISTKAQWPVRIQAEDYVAQSGVSTKKIYCQEGGQQVGWMEVGNWMNFTFTTPSAGIYRINFRTSGEAAKFEVRNPSTQAVYTYHETEATTSAYIYTTSSNDIELPSGSVTIRIHSLSKGWHLNWVELDTTSLILMNKMEDIADVSDWFQEACRVGSLTISDSMKRRGSKAIRFELKKIDSANTTLGSPCIRAEIRRNSESGLNAKERWYAFSHAYTAPIFSSDANAETIAQWHEWPDAGESSRSPPISICMQYGRYYMKVLWAAAAINTNNTKDGEDFYDLGPAIKGEWTDWVIHVRYAWDETGILEIYRNGKKIVDRSGPNCYNDQVWPYFKIGAYKWGWNGWQYQSPGDMVVCYYDEVRIGNQNSNLKEMSAK